MPIKHFDKLARLSNLYVLFDTPSSNILIPLKEGLGSQSRIYTASDEEIAKAGLPKGNWYFRIMYGLPAQTQAIPSDIVVGTGGPFHWDGTKEIHFDISLITAQIEALTQQIASLSARVNDATQISRSLESKLISLEKAVKEQPPVVINQNFPAGAQPTKTQNSVTF